jgi:hypothetical protein
VTRITDKDTVVHLQHTRCQQKARHAADLLKLTLPDIRDARRALTVLLTLAICQAASAQEQRMMAEQGVTGLSADEPCDMLAFVASVAAWEPAASAAPTAGVFA